MKIAIVICALLCSLGQVFAQSGNEPSDLAALRMSWTRAREQAIKPIDDKYVAAVKQMKEKYTKSGNLDAALFADNELKKLGDLPEGADNQNIAADALPGASISVQTANSIKVRPFRAGQPRLYDSDPLRVIEGTATSVSGWKFTSIPQRLQNSYQVTVNAPGVIYAFGSDRTPQNELFGVDSPKWEKCQGPAHGINILITYSRKVSQGESFNVQGFEISLAAKEIDLLKK